MDNFTVAVAGLDTYRQTLSNSFKIFEEFSKKYNLSLKIFEFRKSCDYFAAFMGDTQLLQGSRHSFYSPTIEHQELSIAVPNLIKIPRSENLLGVSLATYNFLILFYSIVILFASIQTIIVKSMRKRMDFVNNILIGIKLSIGSSSKLPKNLASRLLYSFLMFHGLFYNINYSVHFGSFLIKGIPYFNSSVHCTRHDITFLKEKLPNFKDFDFEEVELNVLISTIIMLKIEYGACVTKSMWQSIFSFQRRLRTNIFRLAVGWISGFTSNSFMVFNRKTKFTGELKNFTDIVFCTGLFVKWSEADTHYIQKLSEFKSEPEIVKFEDVRILIRFLYFNYLFAGVIFAFEVISKNCYIFKICKKF